MTTINCDDDDDNDDEVSANRKHQLKRKLSLRTILIPWELTTNKKENKKHKGKTARNLL